MLGAGWLSGRTGSLLMLLGGGLDTGGADFLGLYMLERVSKSLSVFTGTIIGTGIGRGTNTG